MEIACLEHGNRTVIAGYNINLYILPWSLSENELMLEVNKNNDPIWRISYGEGLSCHCYL